MQFRQQDYRLQHEVPFYNASAVVFQGLRGLLDDQVAHRAAVRRRSRDCANTPASSPAISRSSELLKQRELEQIAKPDVRLSVARARWRPNSGAMRPTSTASGTCSASTGSSGWEHAYARLKTQLTDYDTWVREHILPKARTDFRLPPNKYALAFEDYGIDLPPARDRRHGARGLQPVPSADGAARGRGCEGQRAIRPAITAA